MERIRENLFCFQSARMLQTAIQFFPDSISEEFQALLSADPEMPFDWKMRLAYSHLQEGKIRTHIAETLTLFYALRQEKKDSYHAERLNATQYPVSIKRAMEALGNNFVDTETIATEWRQARYDFKWLVTANNKETALFANLIVKEIRAIAISEESKSPFPIDMLTRPLIFEPIYSFAEFLTQAPQIVESNIAFHATWQENLFIFNDIRTLVNAYFLPEKRLQIVGHT
jgi:hypothetical protein